MRTGVSEVTCKMSFNYESIELILILSPITALNGQNSKQTVNYSLRRKALLRLLEVKLNPNIAPTSV